jgi:hypothetical protein
MNYKLNLKRGGPHGTVEISPNATISNLMQQIYNQTKIHPDWQSLFYQDKELLVGSATISDYSISDKTTIEIKSAQITVVFGTEKKVIDVWPEQKVDDIKTKLRSIWKHSFDLYFQNNPLNDNDTLSDSSLFHSAQLFAVECATSGPIKESRFKGPNLASNTQASAITAAPNTPSYYILKKGVAVRFFCCNTLGMIHWGITEKINFPRELVRTLICPICTTKLVDCAGLVFYRCRYQIDYALFGSNYEEKKEGSATGRKVDLYGITDRNQTVMDSIEYSYFEISTYDL